MKTTGDRIRDIRYENGYTLKGFGIEIGKRLGSDRVAEGIISRWENDIFIPNNKRLKVIAELGNTTISYLLSSNPLSDYSTDELLQELERRGDWS